MTDPVNPQQPAPDREAASEARTDVPWRVHAPHPGVVAGEGAAPEGESVRPAPTTSSSPFAPPSMREHPAPPDPHPSVARTARLPMGASAGSAEVGSAGFPGGPVAPGGSAAPGGPGGYAAPGGPVAPSGPGGYAAPSSPFPPAVLPGTGTTPFSRPAPGPVPGPSPHDRPGGVGALPWGAPGDSGAQAHGGPARPPAVPPHSSPRRGLRGAAVAGIAALALVAGAAGGVAADRIIGDDPTSSGTVALPGTGSVPQAERPDGSVADIAATALPSVVSLQVEGDDGIATGSGFVLREDGYILTNNHVVSGGADGGTIVALFADGHEREATLVGRTVDYDLAVVKVDETGLTPLVLGDSDAVVVGDLVVAVGAPLGLNGTVTTGIVSALHRPVQAGEAAETAFIDAIQTDAAINPGNSGGPLVNGSGEVIGINSAIATPPGAGVATGSIGLGFAIPSNQARRTAEQLIENGVATYPVIGVLLDPRYQGEGVQVSTSEQDGQVPVTPDGPADAAGIAPGDVILAIDGRPVTASDELIVAIRAKAPGDTVTLTVRSGGKEREVPVVLDEAESE